MKYVHLQCLQTWLRSKQHLTTAFKSKLCDFFSHKALTCELCKTRYPLTLNLKGKIVYLLQNIENYEGEGDDLQVEEEEEECDDDRDS